MQVLAPPHPCLDNKTVEETVLGTDVPVGWSTLDETDVPVVWSTLDGTVRRDTVFMKPVVLPQELDLHAGTATPPPPIQVLL